MIYPITPCPAPRMTRADRWKKRPCVLRYFAFRETVLAHDLVIGDTLDVIFAMPMPNSWSKKKRAAHHGQPHQQRPDIDNLVKGLLDAVFDDDSHVYQIKARKIWSEYGYISINEGDL